MVGNRDCEGFALDLFAQVSEYSPKYMDFPPWYLFVLGVFLSAFLTWCYLVYSRAGPRSLRSLFDVSNSFVHGRASYMTIADLKQVYCYPLILRIFIRNNKDHAGQRDGRVQ
jgi:hypothetical protein